MKTTKRATRAAKRTLDRCRSFYLAPWLAKKMRAAADWLEDYHLRTVIEPAMEEGWRQAYAPADTHSKAPDPLEDAKIVNAFLAMEPNKERDIT